MAVIPPTQPPQGEKRGFVYAFKRSTWITIAWNWILMLAGKAAEPILTVSVIYSCARLLPGISLPVQLDNTVFICQMVALDIGGLGLRKLANQASKDGNEEGAKLAGRVSTALLVIMGINVALSVLESIAPLDPTFVKVTEGILLIARAIMAVLYAYVIHSLHGEHDSGEAHNAPQPDFQQRLDQALAEQAAQLDQRFQAFALEQSGIVTKLRQYIDDLQKQQQTIDQQAMVSSKQSAPSSVQPLASQKASKRSVGELGRSEASGMEKIRPLHAVESRKDHVVRLWNEDRSRSTQTIAAITGIPKSTVAYYLKPYRDQSDAGETPSKETTA